MSGSRLIPLILAFSMFMENMDATVIATSLATIAADIGTDPISLKLALTSYLVALAIFIPVSGWLADKFGGRTVLQWAMLIFIIGSVACAFANSLGAFVGARFLQGMGGAMMAPLARLLLLKTTPRHELVTATAWLTIPSLIGPICGPPIGGFITTYFSWHWIFFINVPIGIVGIILFGRFIPETERIATPRLDILGFVLVGLCFAGLVFGISVISLPALPMWVGYATIGTGVASGLAYLVHARRAAHPILELGLFRFRLFRASVWGGSLYRIGLGAVPFLLALMLQIGFGLSPFESGMVVFIGAVGMILAKFFARWLFVTYGFRNLLAGACLATGLLIGTYALFDPSTPVLLIMAILFVNGIIQSTFWTGINVFQVADIEKRDETQATTIATVAQQLSFAVGVALGGGILEMSHLYGVESLSLGSFHIAFAVIALVTLSSALAFLFLPHDAGSAMSGHKVKKKLEKALESA